MGLVVLGVVVVERFIYAASSAESPNWEGVDDSLLVNQTNDVYVYFTVNELKVVLAACDI